MALIACSWAPALGAVGISLALGIDWTPVLRVVVTALVFAPVAGIALDRGAAGVGTIFAALALTSGWLAAVVTAVTVWPDVEWLDTATRVALVVARQPETAALGIMPWLLVRNAGVARRGASLAVTAIVWDLLVSAATMSGSDVAEWIRTAPVVLALVSLAASAVVLVRQWRHGDAPDREAVAWFAVGAFLLIVSYVRIAGPLGPAAAAICDAAFVVGLGLLPTAVLAMALRGRGVGLGRERSVFTTIVFMQSLSVAIGFYLVVDQTGAVVGLPPAMAGGFAAGALALSFGEVTRLVRRRTARLYFGSGVNVRQVLGRLGERLTMTGSGASAVEALAASLRASWRLDSVAIHASGEPGSVCVGDPGPATLDSPLTAAGQSVGRIELTGQDDAVLHAAVAPVLVQVAPLIGVAVRLAGLTQEVAAVSARTLGVRREERRMLHRVLRDELAPALAGLGFAMAAAQRSVEAGSPDARPAVADVRAQVAGRAEDVRRLARALLPAALDAGDLDGALRELVQRLASDGVPVSVSAAGTDGLSPMTQVAAYLLLADVTGRLRRLPGARALDLHVGVEGVRAVLRVSVAGAPVPGEQWSEVRQEIGDRASEFGGVLREPAGPLLEIVVPR